MSQPDLQTPTFEHDLVEISLSLDPSEKREISDWIKSNPNFDVHTAEPEIKQLLAKAGIYTTNQPHRPLEPSQIDEIILERDTEKNLETLTDNVDTALRTIQELKDEEFLGHKMLELFKIVDKVRGEYIGLRELEHNKSKALHGTVFAGCIRFRTNTGIHGIDSANLLLKVLQTCLRTKSNTISYQVYFDPELLQSGIYEICIDNYDEYANRQFGNALAQLVARDDKKRYGISLPKAKEDKKTWLEKGETLHPIYDQRLDEINNQYLSISDPAALDYRRTIGKPLIVLGTDMCGVFHAVRDIFRPKIQHLREWDHLNEEQNPISQERLLIEENVLLFRDEAEKGNLHPRRARGQRVLERMSRRIQSELDERRSWLEKFLYAFKIGKSALDIGGTAIDIGLETLRNADRGRVLANKDFNAWMKQLREYEKSRVMLVKLVSTPTSVLFNQQSKKAA
jgi:hypothetical protein